jgi:hypothetical protein
MVKEIKSLAIVDFVSSLGKFEGKFLFTYDSVFASIKFTKQFKLNLIFFELETLSGLLLSDIPLIDSALKSFLKLCLIDLFIYGNCYFDEKAIDEAKLQHPLVESELEQYI